MINKKKNITINLILFLLAILIAFISYFTINYDFRRDTYKRIVAFINLYQFYSIKQHVQSGDTKSAAKKIDNYINFSQKISKGKNAMWEGIYDVTHMISINAKNQEDFNLMQDVYLKLLDIDDDIYLVHVWASRALLDDDESKSVYHLKKAIILSPSNEEAYREILNLFKLTDNVSLISNYCEKYKDSLLGGNITPNSYKFFGGNNLSKFAISINQKNENLKIYPKSIGELNKFSDYNFVLNYPQNINQVDIYLSLLPGTKIEINKIFTSGEKEKEINQNDIYVFSNNSYFLNDENIITLVKSSYDDDLINIKFKKKINLFEKIKFNIRFSRLDLANISFCKQININE